MITREDAKDLLEDAVYKKVGAFDFKYLGTLDKIFDQQDQLEQRIKALEAQLANAEQLTCEGCSHEKQSSPLFIHCLGCNRAKHLKDKFHDINEPCRG